MANEENKNENQENESPAQEEQPIEGLTAEQVAESSYDATEVWNKNKNSLYSLLGVIAIGVAAVSWFNSKKYEDSAERTSRFIEAGSEAGAAEERFLSFAEDYDDTLGGWPSTEPRLFNTGTRDMRKQSEVLRLPFHRWAMTRWWEELRSGWELPK